MTSKFPAYILMALAMTCWASRPAMTGDGNEAKSDYIFYESASMSSLDDEASSFELLRRAVELSPESADLGFQYGLQLMGIARRDSALFTIGYNLADRYFQSGATDYYNLFTFGQINDQIGYRQKSIAIWERLDSLYPKKYAATLRLAETLIMSKDSVDADRALKLYNRLETANGKSVGITYRKIGIFLSRHDTTAVFNEVNGLLASAPLSSEYALMAASIYSSFDLGDSARVYYDRAVSLDPNSGAAIYHRANYYLMHGDSAAYQQDVREALRHESLDFETKMQLISGIVQDNISDSLQMPYIVNLFDEMIDQNPREVDLRELYCSYLYSMDNYSGAAEQLEYAVDVDAANETRWHNLVSLYITLGDYTKVVDASNRALHYFPNSTDFISSVSTGMILSGDYDGAESYLQTVIADADTTNTSFLSNVYTQLGDIASHNDSTAKACGYYAKALDYTPHDPLVLNNYAYLLAQNRQRLDEAEKMSAESLLSRPDEPTYLDTYAWVLFQKKDFQGARKIIDRAIKNSATPASDIYEHAGDIYFFLGETDDAIGFWEQAYELDPTNESVKKKVETRSYPIK